MACPHVPCPRQLQHRDLSPCWFAPLSIWHASTVLTTEKMMQDPYVYVGACIWSRRDTRRRATRPACHHHLPSLTAGCSRCRPCCRMQRPARTSCHVWSSTALPRIDNGARRAVACTGSPNLRMSELWDRHYTLCVISSPVIAICCAERWVMMADNDGGAAVPTARWCSQSVACSQIDDRKHFRLGFGHTRQGHTCTTGKRFPARERGSPRVRTPVHAGQVRTGLPH